MSESDTTEPARKPKKGTFSADYQPKRRRAANKIPLDIKRGVVEGLAAHGEDGKGRNGFQGWVLFMARTHPKSAAKLAERLLPPSIVAAINNNPGPTITSVNILNVPSGEYLSSETIQQLQGSHTVDHALGLLEAPAIDQPMVDVEPEPAIVPRNAEEAALVELSASIKQLAAQIGVSLDDDQ